MAKELQLEPSGKVDMQTAKGIAEVNVYDVQPALVLPAMPDLAGNLQGEIQVFGPVSAPELTREIKTITH